MTLSKERRAEMRASLIVRSGEDLLALLDALDEAERPVDIYRDAEAAACLKWADNYQPEEQFRSDAAMAMARTIVRFWRDLSAAEKRATEAERIVADLCRFPVDSTARAAAEAELAAKVQRFIATLEEPDRIWPEGCRLRVHQVTRDVSMAIIGPNGPVGVRQASSRAEVSATVYCADGVALAALRKLESA
jgi:hypothetical protein